MQPSDVLWGVVKNGVLVLSGFSIGVTVKDGCLHITDGVKGAEQVLVYPRASCSISRIIMLRGWGYISVPAIRWMHEIGVSLIHLGTRGEPLLTTIPSPRTPIPAALRQAQALAFDTDAGRSIARDLIGAKDRPPDRQSRIFWFPRGSGERDPLRGPIVSAEYPSRHTRDRGRCLRCDVAGICQ